MNLFLSPLKTWKSNEIGFYVMFTQLAGFIKRLFNAKPKTLGDRKLIDPSLQANMVLFWEVYHTYYPVEIGSATNINKTNKFSIS